MGAFEKGEFDGYQIYTDQSGAVVRLPDEITEDTHVHVYCEGAIGGADVTSINGKSATPKIINDVYATDENNKDIIIVVNNSSGWWNSDERIEQEAENVERIITGIEQDNSVDLPNQHYYGSSVGGRYAYKIFAYEKTINHRFNLNFETSFLF